MPQEILAPSNAGPAAVEQATLRLRSPNTISPLVPMSISSVRASSWSNLVATMQPTVSPPTNPAMLGRMRTVPAVGRSVSAGSSMASFFLGIYGGVTNGAGSIPSSKWCMAVFPTMAAAVMSCGAMEMVLAMLRVKLAKASITHRRKESPPPSSATCKRDITSAPNWRWGLRLLALASTAPVVPERR